MTLEDKKLLLKDLCARLPYGVKILDTTFKKYGASELINIGIDGSMLVDNKTNDIQYYPIIDNVKPYLRPMSSMTEEEQQKYYDLTHQEDDDVWAKCLFDKMVDFCNERHLDFRGLIEKGLALEDAEWNV